MVLPLPLRATGILALALAACAGDPAATPSRASAAAGAGGASTTTTASSAGGGGAASSSSAGVGGAGGQEDPCFTATPLCPVPPAGHREGSGLLAIDRCAFPLDDRDEWQSRGAIVDALAAALPGATLGDVLADLNRTADPITAAELPGTAPGVKTAFGWQSGDESVAYWIPQGLTGSWDGRDTGTVDGRKVALVSFYYDKASDPGSAAEKGVRLAVVDVTDPAAVSYRFVLLVDPVLVGAQASFVSVPIHAGGIAWFGDLLYVADTTVGLRVFDLTRMLEVDTSVDAIGHDAATGTFHAHGYRYVLPQTGAYQHASACSPRFSFVSLDRSTTPPTLVSGAYDATSIDAPLYRFPLDASTGRLATARVFPTEAFDAGHSHIQGALSLDGAYWLSSSEPAGAKGALYRATEGAPSTTYGWVDTPEDVSYDPAKGELWSLSEGLDARYVFAVSLSSVMP